MSKHCVNHNSSEVKELANSLGLHPGIVAAKIGVWQDSNNSDEYPTLAQLQSEVKPVDTVANPETIERINDFLTRIGVSKEKVRDIVVDGRKIDANGIANLTQKLIQVVEGKEAQALPEEAMHFAVEIIEQKNPALFKKLLSEINNYNLYKQVLRDYGSNEHYQTKDGKPDILKLKKEAIGKLLAATVIDQAQETTESLDNIAKAESMWNRILQFLHNLFNDSGFTQASMDVLSGKDIGTADDIKQDSGVYLQQAPKTEQNRIYDSIKNTSNSIDKTDTGYAVNGRDIATRVSNLIKSQYDKEFTGGDALLDDFTKASFELKANNGTNGHADMEHIFDVYVDGDTGLLRETPLDDSAWVSLLNPNNNDMYDILHENFKQRLYSFDKGTKFLSEATIHDTRRDVAGTVDFLAIAPDGRVSILDWKFIDLNTDKYEDVPWYKVNAWNLQMDQYKYIIASMHGVKNMNFDQTRMIPIKAHYTTGNVEHNIPPQLYEVNIGDVDVKNITQDYLLPVGTKGEKTGIKKIDILVEKLNAIYKKMSEEKVAPEERANKKEQLNALFSAIRQLQMKQNIVPLIHQAKVLNKQIQSTVDEYNNRFKGNSKGDFTPKQISEFSDKLNYAMESLKTYTSLDTELKFLFNSDSTAEEKAIREDLRDVVDDAREYADMIGGREGIDTEFITSFIGSTSAAEKVVTGITKMFGNTASIQLKSLSALFGIASDSNAMASMDTGQEVKRLTKLKEDYNNWAKQKGLTIKNQFSIIKKEGSNELKEQFKSEFYTKLKSKVLSKDHAWVKENIDVDKYKEVLKEKIASENTRIDEKPRAGTPTEIAGQIAREKAKVDALYNISTPTSPGWLMYDLAKTVPRTDLWETDEWKELHKPENAPALAFYNYILEKNKEYADIGYIHNSAARTFLPWVRKGFTEKLIFGGKISMGEEFLRNISMDEGDTGYGQRDPLTGKLVDTIPKYLTHKIDGEVSEDLFKTMFMYNEFAIKFKYMSEIEPQARALIRLEQNKDSIATSVFGKTETKDGIVQYNPDNSSNTKIVEDMVKAIVYQQKYIQSDTFDQVLTTLGNTGRKINKKLGFQLLPEDMEGRQVSINKVITQLNNNFQVLTLGLNPLSALSNKFGGKMQSFINSGKYFTKLDSVQAESWLLSTKMAGSNKTQMLSVLDYFMPFTDNYNRDAGKNLSLSNVTDEHVQDYIMWMMRHSEESVQKTIFYAYLKNSAVVDGNVVNSREYLKKTDEFKDMYKGTTEEIKARQAEYEAAVKEMNETKGVLVLGSVDADGEFSLPGIDRKDKSVLELRRKVQQFTSDALGNLTDENKRLINLNVYGKSFMVFKNWIPRLVDVRMGNLKYNSASDAYEWGRSRMIYRVISEDLLGAVSNLTNTLKGNEQGADFMRQLFEKKRADYEADTGKELEMTETEFIDLVRQNTKSQIVDLLFYAGLMALTLGLKALPPDDDEDPRIKNQYKFLLKATDKLKDEIGYFYDPTSLMSLVKGGVFPSVQMLENYSKILKNFLVENYAIYHGDEKLEEKNHVIKYVMKSFKWTNQASQLLPIFSPAMAKDLGIKMQGQYGIR
jgi:hypothetical protein